MKEFEKWAGPGFYYGKNPSNRPTLEAKRKGWKAALKWVLKNLEEQYEHTAQGDTGWQGKFIEQELLGEQSDDQ